MHHALPRAVLLASTTLVLLAACSREVRDAAPADPAPAAPVAAAPAPAPATAAPPDARTGIDVCDAYLDRYRACHAVIGAYPREEIDERYRGMRDNLVRRAADDAGGDLVLDQCRVLSAAMDEALDGRACAGD